MNKNSILKIIVIIILAMGISGWKPASPLKSAIPLDGGWSGTTHLGQPVSFIAQSGGAQWANFSLTVQITFPSSCTVTMTQTVTGPGIIADGQFGSSSTYFSFTGQFASEFTASGTYSFTDQPSACGDFTHSGTWSAMIPMPAPSAFNKINPPNGSSSQSVNAGLSWMASNYVFQYEYCIDQTDNNDCDTGWVNNSYLTSAGLSGLDTNTAYYWQARALNSNGTTYADDNTWFSFTTGVPPMNFNKAGPANGSVANTTTTFSWEPSGTAASYEICIDPIDNQSCDANWISSGAETSQTLSGLGNHQTFYWQARAFNSGGYTDADNDVWWSFTTVDPPGDFIKTLPSYQSTDQPTSPTLSWTGSSDVDYYEYCYDTSDDEQCDGEWLNAGSNTSAALSGLNTSSMYYWQVRAVNLGGISYPTNNAGWWKFTTAPPLPAGFNKVGPLDNEQSQPPWPTLSWSASSGAADYQYCIDTTDDDQCNDTWTSSDHETSVRLNGLAANTMYYWQVQAINAGGATDADDNTYWSFTTDTPQTGPNYSVNSTSGSKDDLCGMRHCTFRDALNAAETDGLASIIQLQTGTTYTLTEVDNTPLFAAANGLPVISTAITIQGNGATLQRSQESGTPEFRFFRITESGNLTIEDLVLTRGSVVLSAFESIGGAIYTSGQLTIHNSAFVNNSANASGAILNLGTAAITGTIFSQNHAIAGHGTCGSAAISNAGILTVADSQFTNNTSSGEDLCAAGAIDHNGASLTVTNSTFSGHTMPNWAVIEISFGKNATITDSTFRDNSTCPIAVRDGGALHVAGSVFSNNIAYLSGGIYVASGNLVVANSTFWNNTAYSGPDYSNGGGINASGSTVEVTNSTFVNNAAAQGGAIFGSYSTITIRNSILADSAHAENCGGYGLTDPIVDGGHNLDTGLSCNFSTSNHSLSNTNPLLGSLQNNGGPTQTMALLPGSPAIDAADNATCQADPVNNLDQRGALRPVDGDGNGSAICDIGAYEAVYVPIPTHTPTATPTHTETATRTATPTLTSTPTVTKTFTPKPTPTHTATAMRTATPTLAPYPTGTMTRTATRTPVPIVRTLNSVAAQDGWVLESSETSNAGGTLNSAAATFNLGDNAARKQYRGILSFSTGSLPDSAVITGVTLKVRQQGITGGGNPVTAFGGFMLDIKNGPFGTTPALQTGDFQASAGKSYGPFNTALVGGWYSFNLTGAKGYVNKLSTGSGLTQIRLRFTLGDNNNTIANYLSLYSGNAPATYRPQLVVTYYVP
jgi:hypothetical protein